MIIGISGKIGSGKSTVAAMLKEQLGNHWEEKMYAGKIKDIVCLLTNCNRDLLEKQEFKNQRIGDEWGDMTYREMLQKVGTEAMRDNISTNVWVNALFVDYCLYVAQEGHHKLKAGGLAIPDWIITDVRFPNEADAIKERGGVLIRVARPECTVAAHQQQIKLHPSETALDNYNFDYTIYNDGTLEDLSASVQEVLRKAKLI